MTICKDMSREPDLKEMVTFCLCYLITENSIILSKTLFSYHHIAILFYFEKCHSQVNHLCTEKRFQIADGGNCWQSDFTIESSFLVLFEQFMIQVSERKKTVCVIVMSALLVRWSIYQEFVNYSIVRLYAFHIKLQSTTQH